jgi:flavodoxin I
MSHIGLFYGSSDGHTADVAQRIKLRFDRIEPDLVEVIDIGVARPEELLDWDLLILGIPTWNIGELQDDWDIFFPHLDDLDLSGRKIAIFGLGDQYGYTTTFLDAVGLLGEKVLQRGAALVGYWPTDGYQFEDSLALDGDLFMGLALDEDNEPEKTDERLDRWVAQVAEEFGLAERRAQR